MKSLDRKKSKCSWSGSCIIHADTCCREVSATCQGPKPNIAEEKDLRCDLAGRCGAYNSSCTKSQRLYCAGTVPMTDHARKNLIKYGEKKFGAIRLEDGQCFNCGTYGEIFIVEPFNACFDCFQVNVIPILEMELKNRGQHTD